MVLVIHDCNCQTCKGGTPAPRRADGEIVFGGSICKCLCHELEGPARHDFIARKKEFDPPDPFKLALERNDITIDIEEWYEKKFKNKSGYLKVSVFDLIADFIIDAGYKKS